MYKKIIIISLFSFLFSESGEWGVVPMFSATWDNNLGFNYGIGMAIGKWGKGIFTGVYSSYAFSKKGNNFSFGPYSGLGIATFRFGVNRLKLKDEETAYWGIETSPSMIVGHARFGIAKKHDIYKLCYATGLGIF
tara:strand:+ start:3740 stop:4144 length:405 start_codon:yes stop_codon:yes gene_type:complete